MVDLGVKSELVPAGDLGGGGRLHLAAWVLLCLLGLALITCFWTMVPVGERGVWTRFGRVQPEILGEGVHFVIPLVDRVHTLSIRVQEQEISAEASSKDLQDVFADVALNWHLVPERVNVIFQQIGTEKTAMKTIITPAIEEILKAVIARYTAEEIITRREQVKTEVDRELTTRLAAYHLAVDDLSLVHVHFSQQFRDAVEAKQIAEQEAKQAEFVAKKALKQAEMRINLAKGEAEANRILQETLTPSVLRYQALQRWDGQLPLIMGDHHSAVVEFEDLIETRRQR